MGSYLSSSTNQTPAVLALPPPPPTPTPQRDEAQAEEERHQTLSSQAQQQERKLFSVCGTQWPRTLFDRDNFKPDRCYVVRRDRPNSEFCFTVYETRRCCVPANPRETVDFVNRTTTELVAQMNKGIISSQEMQLLIQVNTQYRNKMWAGNSSRMVSPLTYGSQHVVYGVSHLCGSLLRLVAEQRYFTYDPQAQTLTVHLLKNPDQNLEEAERATSTRSHHYHRRSDLVLGTLDTRRNAGYGPSSSKSFTHRAAPY
ncbi:protein ORF77 [Cyprinid herpesvirus 3]|uniref:ORF77R n=1 Tax=Cyprinid herpesvirus 3 TaxID=180230 RepID=A3QMP5_CYHV3|nr:unnamed protein product [Cyprinid herpesvirus 3]ABC55167.1 hypothetical protein [Cyprinid herpesvirus 3]ABG42904.1 protein ORF77 [Cyprinid herpesvirus 3]AIC32432.1 ORF77R [Cyprinid herpesvirus 3]AJP55565.1 protein ORF77 [Cyprinid herpesvirus 3]AJP55720.1 protein ORF77 [Cyprinid herpesvirus 3]